MGLDLELAGVVREIVEGEDVPCAAPPQITKLRDSHHAVARLLARGLHEHQIASITGYAISRIASLKRDPLFATLIESYRIDQRDTQRDLEAMYLGYANDFGQRAHEILLDTPEEVSLETALHAFKTFADRGGMAPVSKSINKNITMNIGERLDAARQRREQLTVIDHTDHDHTTPENQGDRRERLGQTERDE